MNISRPSRRFGIGRFFSGDGQKQRRRVRKKRSKILRFGNSSSSSLGSDLAYGRGYIDRRRSREFSPPSGHRPPRADGDTDRPRPPKRAQTDEEIIELGRQFAEIAKKQNAEDLRAAGRTRPSTLAGAVTALNKIRRPNSGNLNRGAGNSKPRLDSSSDDSDWESAPSDDESSEGDSDSGLAYGSSHHLLSNSGAPSHFSTSVHTAQTYSQDIPLNRKRSLVDPKLFGPINSLRGFVRSPCGFGRVDRSTLGDVRPRHEPSVAPSETVVSAKDAPLHHVHPVATSDPSHFGVGRGSIVSGHQDSPPRSPPDSVPIQQPKPRAPVYAKVFESVDTHPEYSEPQPVARVAGPAAGPGHRGASTSTTSSSDAAIGTLLRAAKRAEKIKYQETRANDAKRQPEPSRDESRNGSYKSDAAASLRDAPSNKPHEEERKATHDVKRERGHRQTKGYVSDHDFRKESPQRDMYRDDPEHIEIVERLKNDFGDSRGLGRGEIQEEKRSNNQYIADELKDDIPAPSAPDIERPKGTIDPFQYQVADDAFPTPRYGTPTRPLTPMIKTVERVPDFSHMESYGSYESWSLEDFSQRGLQDEQKACETTEQKTVPVGTATSAEVVAAEVAEQQHEHLPKHDTGSQDHSQQQSSSPQSKDPVLDDADRAYRETRLARRIREQQERSRSNSPDRSVVDKWKDEKDLANTPQPASSPVTDHPKPKSPYDGPDADVRIDNVLEHPKELTRFRISESRHRSSTFPVFSARDPSAERERPMLNLIRPTPAPSPSPEKQQLEDFYVASSSARTDASPVPARVQDSTYSAPSTSFSKAVSWGENETKHYVVESPEREDDPYSGTKVVIPAETIRSRVGKKNARGAIAAVVTGVGIGAAIASISESVVDANVARENIESRDAPQMSKRRSSLPFDPFDGGPPMPGPKPPGLRSSRIPGRFAEDPVFMANIAAGLEGSGFDPNIVIDDIKFHRRDSPPGSNESFSPSVTLTDRDAWNTNRDSGEFRGTTTVEDESSDNSERTSKLNKKHRRKQERAAKQGTSEKSMSAVDDNIALDMLHSGSEDGSAAPANKLDKAQKTRAQAAASETWGDDHVPWASFSDQREPEPTMDDWVDTSANKKQSKKLKRPIVIQQYLQGDSQQAENVMPSKATGSMDVSKDFEDLKVVERKLSAHDFNANLESTAWDTRPVVDDFTTALPEAPIATNNSKEKTKKGGRRSATDELLPSRSTLPSELPHENSYQIVDIEANPASVDEFDLSKENKKDQSNLIGSGPLLRLFDAKQETPEGNIVDSLSHLRSENTPTTEEEWEDLPEKPKKKKKKSKRGTTTHTRSSLRSALQSTSLPEVSVEVPKKSSNDAAFVDSWSGSAPSLDTAEDEEKAEKGHHKGAPGEFPADEDFSDLTRSPNTDMGRVELRENKESISSSFFDLLKSSIGLGEGKEQSRIQDSAESFLDNAGALDASAGSTGAALPPRPRKSTERATDAAPEIGLTWESQTNERNRTPSPESEFIDPEIVEREIRPAIDPTYGDLLPLPPSRTNTPAPALDDDIPPLPESRPGTPEDDREKLLLSQKSTHVRRRSDIPLRAKTPSHSAIPIQFRLAQRTTPVSPSILKVSSSPSQITATPETGSASKARARPMSWESTRAFKPLLLVERTSREVVVPPTSLKEELRASSIPDEALNEPRSTPSHISIPYDVLQEDHPTRAIAQGAESPELPPLTPVEEPESPTPRPNPVDPVSKNRSSFLLYSSPSSSQDAKDADMSDDSPTQSVFKRHTAFNDLEGNIPGDMNELDLLKPTLAGSTTDAQVATAVVDSHVGSQEALEVLPATKDGIISDIIPSGESAQFSELIHTSEKGVEDIEPTEAVLVFDDKSTEGKQETNQPREMEPFVEAPGVEASVDSEVLSSSGAPESADKTAQKEEDAVLAKVTKKSKKKKKRQSQKPSTDDSKAVGAPITVEDKGDQDKLLDAPAAPTIVEAKPDDGNTEAFVGVYADIPVEAPVEAPVDAPVDAPVEAFPEAPTEAAVDVTAETVTVVPADIAVKSLMEASVEDAEVPMEASIETTPDAAIEALTEPSVEVPAEPLVQHPADIAAEPSTEASIEAPTELYPDVPAKPSAQDPTDIAVEPLAEASAEGAVEAAQGSGYGNTQNKSGARLPSIFDSMARRMFSSTLGIRAPRQTEAQKAYDRAMHEEERKKREASIEEALDGVDEDLATAPTDVVVAPLTEAFVERAIKAPMEAPFEAAHDIEIEALPEALADVTVEAPAKASTEAALDNASEASTEAPIEAAFNIPVENPAEASADILAESPTVAAPDVAVEAPTETFANVPIEAITEASVEGSVEAPRDSSAEADLDVAIESPSETPADIALEAPTPAFAEVPVEAPTEAPADIALEPLTEASVEGAVEAPMEAPIEVPIEAPIEVPIEAPPEGPADVFVDTPVEVLPEPLALGELGANTEKAGREERNSQTQETRSEDHLLSPILDGDSLGDTAINERALVEEPTSAHEDTTLERDISATAPEVSPTFTEEAEINIGRPTIYQEVKEESPDTSIPEATTPPQYPPPNTSSETVYPVEVDTPEHESGQAQSPLIDIQRPSPAPEEGTLDDTTLSATTDIEPPAAAPKKSKKKKKGKASQTRKLELEPLVADNFEIDTKITEEAKRNEDESPSFKVSDEAELAAEATSSEPISVLSADSPLHATAEVVEPKIDASSMQADEESTLASETQQPTDGMRESAVTETQATPEESGLGDNKNDERPPIEAGEPDSASIEGYSASVSEPPRANNTDQLRQEPNMSSDREIPPRPELTDAVESLLTENVVEDLHDTPAQSSGAMQPSDSSLDSIYDAQILPSDQLTGDISTRAINLPEESRGKKKAMKSKKKQPIPSLVSDPQERAADLPKMDSAEELAAINASSPEQTIDPSPTILDTVEDSKQEAQPTDDAALDAGGPSKKSNKSKKGKKNKKGIREPATSATEDVVESPKREGEAALDDQDSVDPKSSTATAQGEPANDDPAQESTMPGKTDEELQKKVLPSIDLTVPTEHASESLVEPQPSVTEGDIDAIQKETGSTLSSTEAELLTEKEIPNTALDAEAVSEKKQWSSPQLDPNSSDTFSERTDHAAVQEDTSALPELPEETTALIEPAADNTNLGAAEVLGTTDDPSLSNEIMEGNKHSLDLEENEDTSTPAVPRTDALSDLTEVQTISQQVNEDDRSISSASMGTKRSTKNKKKKRQSVQFAEPIAESTETPLENTSDTAALESTSKPNELSPDTHNELPTPTELAESSFDAYPSHDQNDDEHALQDPIESYPTDFDPSSVPETVFSPEAIARREPVGDGISEQQNHELVETAEPITDPQSQDNIDSSVNMQPQMEPETQKLLTQTEPIRSDTASVAPVKADDFVLSDDQPLAEAMPVPDDHVFVPVEGLLSVVKTNEPEKSLEIQEPVSDSPVLAATIGEGNSLGDNQEIASSISPYEAEVERGEPVPLEDQGAIEQFALDNTIPENATGKSKKSKKKGKKSSKAQDTASKLPLDVSASSTIKSEGKSQDNIADVPQFAGAEDTLGAPETSDSSKPQTEEQGPPLYAPAVTSSLILDGGDQPSHDTQVGDSAILQPKKEIGSVMGAAIDVLSTGETVVPLAIVPESSIKAQATEELSSEPAEGRKPEIEEKEKLQDDQLLMDQLSATRSIASEPVSDIQIPAPVIEQTPIESLVETAEDQALLAEHAESHTQEPKSHAEIEPSSVAVATPVIIDASIDVPTSSERVSDQLPIDDEATVEDVERPSAKKTKSKKKKKKLVKSEDNEPSLPEPTTQNSASTGLRDTTVLSASSDQPGSLEDHNAAEASATSQIEKDKEKDPANSKDEEVALTSSAERTQIGPDNKDINDSTLLTVPDSTSGDAQPKLVDAHQAQEPVNVDSNFDFEPPAQSQKDEIQELVSPPDKEVVLEPQLELGHAAADNSEQNPIALSVEVESFLPAELPKADDTAELPSPGPTKKTKDKKKKKKKNASLQEAVSIENEKDLADSPPGETQQSDFVVTSPAEVLEGKNTTVENVPKDVDTIKVETPPQDNSSLQDDGIPNYDGTLNYEDATPDVSASKEEIGPNDGDATRTESVPQDDTAPQHEDAPESDDANKADTGLQSQTAPHNQPLDDLTHSEETKTERETEISGSPWENGLPTDLADGPVEGTSFDLEQSAENERQAQEPPNEESIAASVPSKKSKKDKKKKKQLSLNADKLPEDNVTEDPISTVSTDTGKHAEDHALVSTPQPLNEDDPGNSVPEKNDEKDNGKESIPLEDQTPTEQPFGESSADSAAIALDAIDDPSIAEPPAPEPSNDDSPAQPLSTKKTKKSKKKKRQSAALEDEGLELALPKDEVVLKEELSQAPVEEQGAQQEPLQDPSSAIELPREMLAGAEPTNEYPPRDIAQEEASEVAQDILAASETGQVIMPQEMEANASPEPTSIFESGEPANDEATKIEISPVDSFPVSTPTGESKKDKKKMKLASSDDVSAIPHESPQLEESQPLAAADTLYDLQLPTEGEIITAAIIDDAKEEDIAGLVSATTGKKDNKNTKQALPEDLSQTPVEVPVDNIVPDIPGPSEQTEAEAPLPDLPRETEAIDLPLATTGNTSGDNITATSQEDGTISQLEPSQQPGVSRDASAEAPQIEGLPKVASSKGNRKNKKKKRASAGALKIEPEVLTGDNPESSAGSIEAVEPTEISSSSLSEEKSTVPATVDQDTAFAESKATRQDEITNSEGRLDANIQASEPTSVQDSMKIENVVDPGIESKLGEAPIAATLDGATQEPLSEDQQPTPQATEDEPRNELALEAGSGIATDNIPSSSQEPETMQPGAIPKVDGQTDAVPSKKSKKDKKKKKRASQVSWELEPEAEIEDLPEQQQPQQAFDEQPMTNEPVDMGSSGEAVQDPFSEFASGKTSKQNEQRQSQTDWEPEPKSEIKAGEPKPSAPSQLGQHRGILLDHQSLAEDTQTSLKDSINLDDTLLETTSSKKSKNKNKASQLDWNVEPATPVALVPTEDPLPAEQNIIDNHFEPVDVPPTEATETIPEDEADPKNISRAVISPKQRKKDRRKGKKQSVIEIPEVQINTEQSVEDNSTTSDSIPSQVEPDASEKPAPSEETHSRLDASNAAREDDLSEEQIRSFSTEDIEPPADQTQGPEALTQELSAGQNTSVLDTVPYADAESSHHNSSDDQDAQVLPIHPEETLDKVALENQVEARKDTPVAIVEDFPHELPELSTQKSIEEKTAEEAQATSASDADSNEKSGTILQSWNWSNIDNEVQTETLVAGEVSVVEDSSRIEIVEPSGPAQTTNEQEQQQLRDDDIDVDSSLPALDEAKTQVRLGPEPKGEPELERENKETPIARKKSRKDKKKGKGASLSESEAVSEIQAPPQSQYFEADDNPQEVAIPGPKIIEVETKELSDSERPSPESNADKADKIRPKAISSEEISHEALVTPSTSRKPAAPEQLTLDENQQLEDHVTSPQNLLVASEAVEPQQTSTAGSTISQILVHVPTIIEAGQSAILISRTRTPSPNRRTTASVDMSPAQLSSHIEHDRPFDQSTQPDKKVRIHLVEDDAMIAEPFASILEGSDAQIADATAIAVPSQSAEQETEKSEMPIHTAQDSILASREFDPIENDDFLSFSDQKESQDSGLAQEVDKPVPDESQMIYSDRNQEQKRETDEDQRIDAEAIVSPGAGGITVVAEILGASKNEKGNEESRYDDKTTIKNDNVSDGSSLWESSEHKTLDQGSKLNTDSSDFRISSNTDAEPSDEAARELIGLATNEQMRESTPRQYPSANDANAESPVMGRGEVLGTSRLSDVDKIAPQEQAGTAKEQDSWDALDTSELPDDDRTPIDVDATDSSKEPFLSSLPPPRTPSALDYSRSLPPVEEETHEDLEKELQSSRQDKTWIGLEVNRDSGVVTDSPSPQQRNLSPGEDEGQRDSGVHLRSWAEVTTPGRSEERASSKQGSIPAGPGPMGEGSSSQTPQSHERRSRRSLFDGETPTLSTPTPSRGWDRGATPEKPVEDEPLKRIVTPLKSRPQYQTQRSVSDNVSDISRGATPQAESARSASNMSISRLRTPESLGFRPDSPGNHSIRSIHSIRSLRSAGANTPPLRSRRVGGDLRSLSHTSHTSLSNASNPSLSVSTRDRDSDKDKDGSPKDPDRDRDTAKGEASDRHALHTNTTPIANEGRVRAKDMPDVYVSASDPIVRYFLHLTS